MSGQETTIRFEWRCLHDGEVVRSDGPDGLRQHIRIQGERGNPRKELLVHVRYVGAANGWDSMVWVESHRTVGSEFEVNYRSYPVADVRILARVVVPEPPPLDPEIIREGNACNAQMRAGFRRLAKAARKSAAQLSVGVARAVEGEQRFRAALERADAQRALAKQRPFLKDPRARWWRRLLRVPGHLLCLALRPVAWLWRHLGWWTWRVFIGLVIVGAIGGIVVAVV